MQLNTPEEELYNPLYSGKNVRVFLKRDDTIHPFISGNKWRKSKYILAKAELENKKHLVTFGGAWSNHVLATACAGAKFGFKTTAFIRGEEVINPVLTMCKLFGMQLLFVTREAYRNKEALFHDRFNNDGSAFFIDEGGAGAEAAKGCAELVVELQESYDHIFCAAGTGTTSAGIINGIVENNLRARFSAVSVLKNGDFLKSDIQNLLTEPTTFNLVTGYDFGGYAKTSDELLIFIKQFASSTGILLDPIYTGKMMFAIHDLIKNDFFKPGNKVLAIHTGGLTGLLGKVDSFYRLE